MFGFMQGTHQGAALLDGSESDGVQALAAGDDTIGEWSGAGGGSTLTANAALAPDGTTTAASVIESGASGERHIVYASNTFIATNKTRKLSIYAKAIGRRYVELSMDGGNVVFDLIAGAVVDSVLSVTQSAAANTIEAGANGYYKCTFQCFDTAAGNGYQEAHLSDRATVAGSRHLGATAYNGDGTSGVYLWRPKLVVT